MKFDLKAYWNGRGKTYESDFRRKPGFDAQERQLVGLLKTLKFRNVLEVGCGFGRITELIYPMAHDYTAVDISEDQIAAAKSRVPGASFIHADFMDLKLEGQWDLVIATEVLMHIPPADIEEAVRKLREATRHHLITVDWALPFPSGRAIAAHNWLHPYHKLLGFSEGEQIEGTLQVMHHVTIGGQDA